MATRAAAVLGELYGEQAMAAHYQTKADDVIVATDVPERLQVPSTRTHDPLSLP